MIEIPDAAVYYLEEAGNPDAIHNIQIVSCKHMNYRPHHVRPAVNILIERTFNIVIIASLIHFAVRKVGLIIRCHQNRVPWLFRSIFHYCKIIQEFELARQYRLPYRGREIRHRAA